MSFSWEGQFEVAEVKNDLSIKMQESWGSQIKDKYDKKYVKTLRIPPMC